MIDTIFLIRHSYTFLLRLNFLGSDGKHLQLPIEKIIKWKWRNNQRKYLKKSEDLSFACFYLLLFLLGFLHTCVFTCIPIDF